MTFEWGDDSPTRLTPAAPAQAVDTVGNHSSCGTAMRAARPEDMTPRGRTPEPISDEYAWGFCPRCKVLVAVLDTVEG